MLREFIELHRAEIIRRCRAKVAARSVPPPTQAEIDHGVPLFLDQLGHALRHRSAWNGQIGKSAGQHGHDLLLQGLTVSQVVRDYGDICQAITELALETQAPLPTDDFRVLNRCLDDAIASAVTVYGRESNQSSVAGESARGSERLGFFVHELNNLIDTATLAFGILRTGDVGVGGSTGDVVQRSLTRLRDLVARSMAEIRLTQGIQHRERLSVAELIADVSPAAALEAASRATRIVIESVPDAVFVQADRQVLAAVIGNLLQNAFKFTPRGTSVTLRVGASAERVLIQVQDECGGLPAGNPDDLFRPFEQRGTDRTGAGLGLAFCRWAVESNEGRIYAHDLPDRGCVFTIDLPRCPAPVPTAAQLVQSS